MRLKLILLFLFTISLYNIKGQISTNGLVLYLPLSGNVKDSSSYSNNGVNYGVTPVPDRFGKQNKAMYFNGTSHIEITNSSSLNLTKDKTLSCWIYIPSNVVQNWYPTLINKPEPIYSATYDLQLDDYYGYSNDVIYRFSYYFASGNSHYQVFSKQQYTNYKDSWLHIATTYDTISGYSKMYFNGIISDSTYIGKKIANSSTLPLYIGCGSGVTSGNYTQFFKGYIDEVRIYNRAISKNEVYNMYMEGVCSNSIKNDTTTFYITSESFKSISPQYQLTKTDNLKTKVGNCDSIINHYAKFEYSKTTGISSTLYTQGNLKIYPNPAKDYVTITLGDYNKTNGYYIVIRDLLGKEVYSTTIVQESTNLNVNEWNGRGLYVIQLFDKQNGLIDTEKLIVK